MRVRARRGILVIASVLGLTMSAHSQNNSAQNNSPQPLLQAVPAGMTKIVDLSYAINDKLVAWPGDDRVFEAKVNGTVEKDGYYTRSFWMLEHYGTHLDAPIHFPPAHPPKFPSSNLPHWLSSPRR